MSRLSEEQIQKLISGIRQVHPKLQTLSHELIDHLASMIEGKMEEGNSFEDSLQSILSEYTPEELNLLSLNSDDIKSRKNKQLEELINLGALAGLGICIWVALELVAFIIFDIEELGWFYGLISIFILGYFTHRSFKINPAAVTEDPVSFSHLFLRGMFVTAISSIVLFLFLIVYVHYINPNLIGLGNQIDTHNKIHWAIIISMPIGLVSEGILVSLVLAAFSRKKSIA